MYLAQYPRRRYTEGHTPLEKLERLTAAVGGANIYIKRDDLLGLTGGGNKTRKLEFLVADALKQGADTLITCGGIQSNHCRLTLAAAVKEGLKCRLILLPYTDNRNQCFKFERSSAKAYSRNNRKNSRLSGS
ncbi:pyridoxal-phosphate dependent enzyme [Pelosinus baikalensis]|nr:pyridoxal-phosphate dependent enzyme [Pelosinus baikalensis]